MALTKSLTTLRGAGLMLNIVIGAGLLALPGMVVEKAGHQALWAWALCALAALPLLLVFVVLAVKLLLDGFFATQSGLAIRATGSNARMARAQGVNTGLAVLAGVGSYLATRALTIMPIQRLLDEADLARLVKEQARPGDMVVCLGAGTISGWANGLPARLLGVAA